MAGVYAAATDGMLTGDIDVISDEVRAWLVTDAYTPNYSTHSAIADVPSGARVMSAVVTGKNVTNGRFTASGTTFAAATGPDVSAIVLEAAGTLLAYVDDFGAGPGGTTLSLNGSDITVNWPGTGIIAVG